MPITTTAVLQKYCSIEEAFVEPFLHICKGIAKTRVSKFIHRGMVCILSRCDLYAR
jgi:hypothetical protein